MKNSEAAQSRPSADVLAGLEARRLDRLDAEFERGFRRRQVGREAALVADIGVVARLLERALERMEGLRAPAHGVGEGRRADRQDHELLEVDRIVGMDAAIDDIHHRRRQDARRRSADIAVERQAGRFGRGLGDRERHAEDGVGPEPRLVGRAVEGDHRLVDLELVLRLEAGDRVENVAIDRFDRLQHALAADSGPCRRRAVRPPRACPVEAPDGTAARPIEPSSSTTSTSTVGLPRLSRISRATMFTMAVMKTFLAGGFGAAFTPSRHEAEDVGKSVRTSIRRHICFRCKTIDQTRLVQKKMHGRPALPRDTGKKVD